jgi:trk system potassium uptake protein
LGSASHSARFWVIETGPLAFVVTWALVRGGSQWQLAAVLAGGGALSAGGALTRWSRPAGATIATAGLAALVAGVAPEVVTRPLFGLVALFTAIALAARVWSPTTLEDLIGRSESHSRSHAHDLRLAAGIALLTWLFGVAVPDVVDPWMAGASATASLVVGTRALVWGRGVLSGRAQAFATALVSSLVVAAILSTGLGTLAVAPTVLAAIPAGALVFVRVGAGVQIVDTGWAALVVGHPARLVVGTFLLLCVVGFGLLSLPVCADGRAAIAAIDAAFTAVSAVCVTGLITVDTPHAWSNVGQGIMLVLIQLGGLGIMTLSTAALGMVGRRLSVRHEEAVASVVGSTHRGHLFTALRTTIVVTLLAELAGATCLTGLFWLHGDGPAQGLWRGVFTAISAFCNAGFALQTESLVPYQTSPAVLHIVALLIIAGGLSPAAIVALPRWVRHQVVPLQVKVVLVATSGLLAPGMVSFAVMEWENSLAGLSVVDRFHNAWFQSVTFRTAGFNSVDFGTLHSATLLLALLLMFIGGAPGGTAGGIKVTTAWVLGATVAAVLRGQKMVTSFGRTISDEVVRRAIAITAIGAVIVLVVLFALFLTQDMPPSLAVFEALSAIGTVGLSIGGTGELDGLGKVVIMIAMFLGRVGPLTAFLFLIERERKSDIERIDENVEVG